jgi:periplasmic copper chaperone A
VSERTALVLRSYGTCAADETVSELTEYSCSRGPQIDTVAGDGSPLAPIVLHSRRLLREVWYVTRGRPSEFSIIARILKSDYGLIEREVSVVSVFLVHRPSSATRAAESASFGNLGHWIPDHFSSCEPAKDQARSRDSREASPTIKSYAIETPEEKHTSEPLVRIAATIWPIASPCLAGIAFLCFLLPISQVFGAQGEGVIVSDAWVPAIDEVGRDVPLLVAIRNETDSPDALMRVRCPVANFFERHTVDRGEGAPAMRPISSIPVPASSTVVLKPTEYHVMLLQIRQPLGVGEHFKCTLVFQKAGAIETEVEVR